MLSIAPTLCQALDYQSMLSVSTLQLYGLGATALALQSRKQRLGAGHVPTCTHPESEKLGLIPQVTLDLFPG